MVRRLVAAGAGIVVLLLLVFGLRSCLNSRKDSAYRDYNREVSDLVEPQAYAFHVRRFLGRRG